MNEMNFAILHGPNLNLLGERSTEIYGTMTLDEINGKITTWALENGVHCRIHQTNHEGEIIDWLHEQRNWADGIVINPAAYTHTSIAIRDAIEAISIPVVEVHLSDPETREAFRQISHIRDVCIHTVKGHGWSSYIIGLEKLLFSKRTDFRKTTEQQINANRES